MCGYCFYFNNVFWYIVYGICNLNKKVLVLLEIDFLLLIILLDDILNKVFKFVKFGR